MRNDLAVIVLVGVSYAEAGVAHLVEHAPLVAGEHFAIVIVGDAKINSPEREAADWWFALHGKTINHLLEKQKKCILYLCAAKINCTSVICRPR